MKRTTKRRRTYTKRAPQKRRPSPLEDRFAQLIEQNGWGDYEREKTGLVPGRRFRVDFWFPSMNLAVEIDGVGGVRSGHCTPKGVTNDREKDSLLQLMGYRVLRFTTHHFSRDHGQYVIDTMDEAVRRWRTTT